MGVWFATNYAGRASVEAARKPASLRIAHVVGAVGWGGMEARTLETARWQAANGHDVMVVTPEAGETFAEAARCGLKAVHADFGVPDKLGGLLRFRRLLRGHGTDVADFHTNRSYAFGVRDLCALVRSRHNLGRKSAAGLMLNKEHPFHHFISTSRAAQEALVGSGAVRPSRSSVVGEWAEDRFFSPTVSGQAVRALRERLGLATDRPLIGACAMIRPDNAFDELIRATAALRDRGLPVTCAIVGGPSERRAELSALELDLRALAEDLDVADQVRFLGHRSDVPELLSAMDLVAIVSRHTAQTRVGPEAAARGRPVVGFAVGALGETVREGLTGRLTPPGDLPAFVGALEQLLKDQAERERLARSAELFARQNFRQGQKMEQTLRAYEQAAVRCRRRPASSPARLDASSVQTA